MNESDEKVSAYTERGADELIARIEKASITTKRDAARTLPGRFFQKRIAVAVIGTTNDPMIIARPPNEPPGKNVGSNNRDPPKILKAKTHSLKISLDLAFLMRNKTKYVRSRP